MIMGRDLLTAMKFNIKHLQVPLLTPLDGESFWKQFATHKHWAEVEFTNDQYEIIAQDLELTADGLVNDIFQYTSGQYRPNTLGPSGNRLGDFAEAITLLYLKQWFNKVVRIVGSVRPPGSPPEGRFPRPDFLVEDGNKIGCLEVKSTEALSLSRLCEVNKYLFLKPCQEVEGRRLAALEQLGYDQSGKLLTPNHSLKLQGGRTVQFPSDFAVGIALLALDGRIAKLGISSDPKKYRTPRPCQDAGRNCWNCLQRPGTSAPGDLVLARMNNSPGALQLLPSGPDRQEWIETYTRWSQAIWSREPSIIQEYTQQLRSQTINWISELGFESRQDIRRLRAAWDEYLWASAMQRGIRIDMPEMGQAFSGIEGSGEVSAIGSFEPIAERVREEEVYDFLDEQNERRRFLVASTAPSIQNHLPPYTIDQFEDGSWELRLCSRSWRDGIKLRTEQEAASVAREVLRIALRLGEFSPISLDWDPPMKAILNSIEYSILGWRIQRRWEGGGSPRSGAVHWLHWLSYGDARAKLFVYPDGRAYLRLARRE